MTSIKYLFIILIPLLLFSCDKKPKIIVEDTTGTTDTTSGPQTMASGGAAPGMDGMVHRVVANEILQTERYTYMNVTEAGKNFWIATSKVEAVKGKPYIYRGGLMKTPFRKPEFKGYLTRSISYPVWWTNTTSRWQFDNAGVEQQSSGGSRCGCDRNMFRQPMQLRSGPVCHMKNMKVRV